jgi:hypothetical protein
MTTQYADFMAQEECEVPTKVFNFQQCNPGNDFCCELGIKKKLDSTSANKGYKLIALLMNQ